MSTEKYDKLKRKYDAAKAESDMWRPLLLDCYQYALPQRNQFITYSPGQKKTDMIFDSTAPTCVFKFASNLQSALVPPGRKWCKLIPGSEIKEQGRDQIEKLLDVFTDKVFSYINNSNFAMAASESIMDLSVGTLALLCQETTDDDNPFTFTAVSLDQVSPQEHNGNSVENVWRTYSNLKARDVKTHWPKATIPDDLRRKIEDAPNEDVKIVDGVVYKYDEKKKAKYCYYVLSLDDQQIIFEEESASSPWIVARWSKIPGEVFGRGPVMQVLPDIKTLNKITELTLIGAAMTVTPPYMAYNDDIFNPWNTQLEPNTIISVSPLMATGQWPIAPLPRNGDPNFGNLLISDLRNTIKEGLFTDALGPVGGPQMSATEVYARQQNLFKVIGSAFGRLQVEFLSKVIDRVIFILKKKGLIEPIVIDGKEISIKYQSPLSQAQNQDDVQAFQTFIQMIAAFSGQNAGEVLEVSLHTEKLPMWLAENIGVPLKLVKSDEEIRKIKDAIAARAEQQIAQQDDFSVPEMQPPAPQGVI